MSRPLALLRPEPGWSASAAAARAAGLAVVGHPLFEAEAIHWSPPAERFDALLIGSAAVFTHGGPELARYRSAPVHAVGEATARAASAAGFHVATVGTGGLQGVLDAEALTPLRYLRLGGEERLSLVLNPGQTMVERAVYRFRSLPIDAAFAAHLACDRPLVALHSAAAARHFAGEIERFGIARAGIGLLALGPRIAAAAGPGWAGVDWADRPDDGALLVKALTLCK
ncbi:uroporphyrinogen-III synthase [Qipengyuania sediminis]|uniref:uroporphyrinogen-III synthase n=1 Tax=Qipengyuania sediminis TaxID=1532023 RepID=UPI001059D3C3|nr:uroporphyrinogen-III synthase [Qipengyuania sediminis]